MIKRHIGAMIGAFLLSLAHLPLSADDAPTTLSFVSVNVL